MDSDCTNLDGQAFFHAFQSGCRGIFRQTENLNRINVFPVADRDTGTNLSLSVKSVLDGSAPHDSLTRVLSEMSEAALTGAQGNSGIIFAQYLMGLNSELKGFDNANIPGFANAARKSVRYVYDALLNPMEGTVLTVMKDWADELVKLSGSVNDFRELFTSAIKVAQTSLANTPQLMKLLAEAGVPDAGAQGFVNFLEGVGEFITNGCVASNETEDFTVSEDIKIEANPIHSSTEYPVFRYCAEAILTRSRLTIIQLKEKYRIYGDSLILAGTKEKLHLHIHSNEPGRLFQELHRDADVSGVKADDMLSQYNIVHNRKAAIGLMSDTAADLPAELIEQYQILQIPFGINFPHMQFLDKVTIQPHTFYKLLEQEKQAPASSLPSLKVIDSSMHFLETQYEQSICLHISSQLSSTFQFSSKLSEKHAGIAVLDSKHLSVSEGLLLLRIAKAIETGMSCDSIIDNVSKWSSNTFIYTDIATLKYMVRSGRVSPLKGLFANLLNIKPIVSVDASGKGIAYGKSFSRKGNMEKILGIIKDLSEQNIIWEYAIVHSASEKRALVYAERLNQIIGKAPAYIMPLSPVIGVHNGIGAVAVGISLE